MRAPGSKRVIGAGPSGRRSAARQSLGRKGPALRSRRPEVQGVLAPYVRGVGCPCCVKTLPRDEDFEGRKNTVSCLFTGVSVTC